MLYDFHTHTFLSDGELSPIELIRRASSPPHNYRVIALTDHIGSGSLERVISETIEDCRIASSHWNIIAIPGVELTHLPSRAIAPAARKAKELGAKIVVVHGETIVEPVEKGINLEAIQSPDVDILAHPGLLTLEEAELAVKNNIFIEISARSGHCLTNGHIGRLMQTTGIKLLLNSDSHGISDILTPTLAVSIIKGAGLEEHLQQIMSDNPLALLNKLELPEIRQSLP